MNCCAAQGDARVTNIGVANPKNNLYSLRILMLTFKCWLKLHQIILSVHGPVTGTSSRPQETGNYNLSVIMFYFLSVNWPTTTRSEQEGMMEESCSSLQNASKSTSQTFPN